MVDSGKQFDCYEFREYCRMIVTKLHFASVYHPQSNCVVERVRTMCGTRTGGWSLPGVMSD
jgi:hypothetical protein